ncbi:hypothetical protein Tco_1013794 [Tanacetum coccineum]
MIVKHLWHVAIEKNSLWVKWIHIIKLKGRSIWAVNEEEYDSWGCKNILRLRDEVRKFMVIKIGNGEKTSVTYDNWCNVGILQSILTNRDIYNARVSPEIVKISIDESKNDELVWRSKKGKEGKFTVKQTYEDLRSNDEEVEWCRKEIAEFSKEKKRIQMSLLNYSMRQSDSD